MVETNAIEAAKRRSKRAFRPHPFTGLSAKGPKGMSYQSHHAFLSPGLQERSAAYIQGIESFQTTQFRTALYGIPWDDMGVNGIPWAFAPTSLISHFKKISVNKALKPIWLKWPCDIFNRLIPRIVDNGPFDREF